MVDQKDDSKLNSLYSKPSGNPYAFVQDEDNNSLGEEPTEAQKRAYIKKLQNPHAHTAIFGDLDSDELSEEWVLKILSSYLPRSSQSRDRKIINDMTSEFVAQAKILTSGQKRFVKQKLLSMKPEGEMRLEAARTTLNSIRIKLQKLLDEAKKQQ